MCDASNVATNSGSLLNFLKHHGSQVCHLWERSPTLRDVILQATPALWSPMVGTTLSPCVFSAHLQASLELLYCRLSADMYRVWHVACNSSLL